MLIAAGSSRFGVSLREDAPESTAGIFGLAACTGGNGGSGGGGVRTVARVVEAGERRLRRGAAEGTCGLDSGETDRNWLAAELGADTMAVVALGIGVR